MNRMVLLAALGLGLSAAAFADQATTPSAKPDLQPMEQVKMPEMARPDASHCLTTGSHLSTTESGDCVAANGRVYTRGDMMGGVNWTDVLRRDPSIMISGSKR